MRRAGDQERDPFCSPTRCRAAAYGHHVDARWIGSNPGFGILLAVQTPRGQRRRHVSSGVACSRCIVRLGVVCRAKPKRGAASEMSPKPGAAPSPRSVLLRTRWMTGWRRHSPHETETVAGIWGGPMTRRRRGSECHIAEAFSVIIVPAPPASAGSKEKHDATHKRYTPGDDRQRLPSSMIQQPKMQ